MNIDVIKKIAAPYIEKTTAFEINIVLFKEVDGRKKYNKKIRNQVGKKFGIYVWVNKKTGEIIYIGMAGKVKNDGTMGDHTIQDRLVASRGVDKNTKKDIQTNDYVFSFMKRENICSLQFYIMYSREGIPPTFIESLVLYEYFKEKNKLPKLNNSF